MKTSTSSHAANYNGYSRSAYVINSIYQGENEGRYVFTDEFDETIQFHSCNELVLREYDLNGTKEIGRLFTVTYLMIQEDEHEEVELEIINIE